MGSTAFVLALLALSAISYAEKLDEKTDITETNELTNPRPKLVQPALRPSFRTSAQARGFRPRRPFSRVRALNTGYLQPDSVQNAGGELCKVVTETTEVTRFQIKSVGIASAPTITSYSTVERTVEVPSIVVTTVVVPTTIREVGEKVNIVTTIIPTTLVKEIPTTQFITETRAVTEYETRLVSTTIIETRVLPTTLFETETVEVKQIETKIVPTTEFVTQTAVQTKLLTTFIPRVITKEIPTTRDVVRTLTVTETRINNRKVPTTVVETRYVPTTQFENRIVTTTELETRVVPTTQFVTVTVPTTRVATTTIPTTVFRTQVQVSTQVVKAAPITETLTVKADNNVKVSVIVPSIRYVTKTESIEVKAETITVPTTVFRTEIVPTTVSVIENVVSTKYSIETTTLNSFITEIETVTKAVPTTVRVSTTLVEIETRINTVTETEVQIKNEIVTERVELPAKVQTVHLTTFEVETVRIPSIVTTTELIYTTRVNDGYLPPPTAVPVTYTATETFRDIAPAVTVTATKTVSQPCSALPTPVLPRYKAPAPKAPTYKAPAPKAPKIKAPAVEKPKFKFPAVEIPKFKAPAPAAPVYQAPAYVPTHHFALPDPAHMYVHQSAPEHKEEKPKKTGFWESIEEFKNKIKAKSLW